MNIKQSNKLQIVGPSKDFESIKKLDGNGIEYWEGRELMKMLEYTNWQNFEIVINKAQQACLNSRQFPQDHFTDINKMVGIGSKTSRKVNDYKLDRYACYLIAQNGDSTKQTIAIAQTYFAIQTRKQEIMDGLSFAEKKIAIRDGVVADNENLFSVASAAGISNFGAFDDAGYQGLYGMHLSEVEEKKGVKKGQLLNHADSAEFGANIFRITQTEEKLKRDGVQGDIHAQSVHFKVGSVIRETIKSLGNDTPENLKSRRHVSRLKKTKSTGRINGSAQKLTK